MVVSQAVILCGGLGTRLRAVVNDRPKALAEVNDRPLLAIILDDLTAQGITDVVLATGYMSEKIEIFLRQYSGSLNITISREEQRLGTGGALKLAWHKLKPEPFLVLNGDTFLPHCVETLIQFHQAKNAEISLVLVSRQSCHDSGTVVLDESERIVSFNEKQASNGCKVNAGMYLFNFSVLSRFPQTASFSLEQEVFSKTQTFNLYGCEIASDFLDIGTPETLKKANNKLIRRSKVQL